MKKTFFSALKIYLPACIYLFLISFFYSIYLIKTGNDSSIIFLLAIGATLFIILGFLYGNMIHKRGLIIGIIVGITHIFLLYLIIFLATSSFNFNPFLFFIYLISAIIGSIFGINFKKII